MPEENDGIEEIPGTDEGKEKIDPARILVIDEIIDILGKEDVAEAVKSYKAESEEQKTAIEFVNAHIQFIRELVENDYNKNIQRKDIEIRDIVANINSMLKEKHELLFSTMILKSPLHYRHIQAEVYK